MQKKLSQIIPKLNLEYSEIIILVRKNEEMNVCIFFKGVVTYATLVSRMRRSLKQTQSLILYVVCFNIYSFYHILGI